MLTDEFAALVLVDQYVPLALDSTRFPPLCIVRWNRPSHDATLCPAVSPAPDARPQTQVPPPQNIGELQLLPAQQGCPNPPHATHPVDPHTAPVWQLGPVVQHCEPMSPHC
jgi:hypothetical protein